MPSAKALKWKSWAKWSIWKGCGLKYSQDTEWHEADVEW